MSHYWWDILELSKDADLRDIKKAYAAKLKSISQADDPAGFMALRQAYETARSTASWRESQSKAPKVRVFEDLPVKVNPENSALPLDDAPWEPAAEPIVVQKEPSNAQVLNSLIKDMDSILKSPFSRNDDQVWQTLLDDERLLNLDIYADFTCILIDRIIYNIEDNGAEGTKSLFSKKTISLFFRHFEWQKRRNVFHYNHETFEWIIFQHKLARGEKAKTLKVKYNKKYAALKSFMTWGFAGFSFLYLIYFYFLVSSLFSFRDIHLADLAVNLWIFFYMNIYLTVRIVRSLAPPWGAPKFKLEKWHKPLKYFLRITTAVIFFAAAVFISSVDKPIAQGEYQKVLAELPACDTNVELKIDEETQAILNENQEYASGKINLNTDTKADPQGEFNLGLSGDSLAPPISSYDDIISPENSKNRHQDLKRAMQRRQLQTLNLPDCLPGRAQ